MHFTPKPYQQLGIDWLSGKAEAEPEAAALFAGMGLGKSVMTLAAYHELACTTNIKGMLIIAPLRVSTLAWPKEIRKWDQFKWMKVAMLRTPEGVQAWKDGSADVYLLNYERIPQFLRDCVHGRRRKDMPVDLVVWDELSKCKSHKSKRINLFREYTKAKKGTPCRFPMSWGLTGTPRPNGYLDLFAQIRLLDGGKRLGKSFTPFQDNWFHPINPRSDHPKYVENVDTADMINRKVADLALVLRSEDYLDIPPMETIDIDVPLNKAAMKAYEEVEDEFLTYLETGGEVVAQNLGVQVFKLLQITSGAVYDEEKEVHFIHDAKVKALKKVQKECGKEPILVATKYRHEYTRILEAFPEAELFNDSSIERWNKGEIRMLVAHPLSIGHGVDGLQDGGRNVCWFTPTHSADEYDQYNARLARMGQSKSTRVYRLLCPGTVDDAAVEVVRGREEGQTETLAMIKNLQDLARARRA